jgi:hypothetical protein
MIRAIPTTTTAGKSTITMNAKDVVSKLLDEDGPATDMVGNEAAWDQLIEVMQQFFGVDSADALDNLDPETSQLWDMVHDAIEKMHPLNGGASVQDTVNELNDLTASLGDDLADILPQLTPRVQQNGQWIAYTAPQQ